MQDGIATNNSSSSSLGWGRGSRGARDVGIRETVLTPSSCGFEFGASATKSESILDALQDPDSLVFDLARSRVQQLGYYSYFALCLVATLTVSAAAVSLWSDMVCGPHCLEYLQKRHHMAPYCGGLTVLVILTLYLLDFFCPPHLPGLYCTLSSHRSVFAKCCLFVAVAAFLAMGCFLALYFPTIPLVLNIFLAPVIVLLLRLATMPRGRFVPPSRQEERDRKGDGIAGLSRTGFEKRMQLLKRVTCEEQDQKNFYLAATYAFCMTGLLCFCTWVPWAATDSRSFTGQIDAVEDREERELVFVRRSSPVVIAVSNLVFASFTGLRVALNRTYNATDKVKNRLIIGGTKSCMNEEMMEHRISMLRERLEQADQSPDDIVRHTQDKIQQYLVQHISHMRQLSNIVKLVGCAFIALLGALYIALQLTAADSHIAFMIQGFLGAFLLTFVCIVCVSFSRLWQAMGVWLADLPLWKAAASLSQRDWAIAFVICMAFPLAPFVLVLSFANQRVRHCRGLCTEQTCFTSRVHEMLRLMREWNWVGVIFYCYVAASAIMLYKMIPLLLNVLLAWMSSLMDDLGFAWILFATFMAGMVLFMLPPIPGPPIYLFGGVVISEKCPWGFWWGSFICIALCFALKLVACAVQQKLFGEKLGNVESVRRAVGIHKPLIRAIEAVLRKPGLSFGKCMILCGGPDWPTSVLAGILRISVWQCLLGTLPIILNIIPLTLTGSFYLKRDVSPVWVRAGNLMFVLTALVSVVFWVGMGWAIQDILDREHESLKRPKVEYIDLEWLDHRACCMEANCVVSWRDLPFLVKVVYPVGAACLTCVSLLIFWRSAWCFGKFRVTDDIRTLDWFGHKGLVQLPGAIGLSIAAVGYIGLVMYLCWSACRNGARRAQIAKDLDETESAWKEQRLHVAQEAGVQNSPPRAFGSAGFPHLPGLEEAFPEVPMDEAPMFGEMDVKPLDIEEGTDQTEEQAEKEEAKSAEVGEKAQEVEIKGGDSGVAEKVESKGEEGLAEDMEISVAESGLTTFGKEAGLDPKAEIKREKTEFTIDLESLALEELAKLVAECPLVSV